MINSARPIHSLHVLIMSPVKSMTVVINQVNTPLLLVLENAPMANPTMKKRLMESQLIQSVEKKT